MVQQISKLWQQFSLFQKISLLFALGVACLLIGAIFIYGTQPRYVPLFPNEKLPASDTEEIKKYIEAHQIPYSLEGESLLLLSEDVYQVRKALASAGLPKRHEDRGFELFDTNTWLKGEKELQVMEMRALKGQLEQDLCEYDMIRSAHVELKIAPPTPYRGKLEKTEASIIVGVAPGTQLSPSLLRAISHHVAGAVPGLEPNRIAISDTTGRSYQTIHEEGTPDRVRNAEIDEEEEIKSSVDKMLALVVGAANYHTFVHVILEDNRDVKEPQGTSSENSSLAHHKGIDIDVMINKAILEKKESGDKAQLRQEIHQQVEEIVSGYSSSTQISVTFMPFYENKAVVLSTLPVRQEASGIYLLMIAFILAIGGGWAYLYFKKSSIAATRTISGQQNGPSNEKTHLLHALSDLMKENSSPRSREKNPK